MEPFKFKQFTIKHDRCIMKIGTDGVLLGAWTNVEEVKNALDIGTGSGVIAIMIAQRNPEAHIDGIEIDGPSYHQAAENMECSPWAHRVRAIAGSIQDYAATCQTSYDLIVSNPPFFSEGPLSKKAERNHVRRTIKLPSHELLTAVQKLLSPDGRFCVILPDAEGLRFIELAKHDNLYCTHITEVRPRPQKPVERLLMQFEKKKPDIFVKDQLLIHHETGQEYTDEYIALTREFYLYMK